MQKTSVAEGVNCLQALEEGWVIVDGDIGCRLEKWVTAVTLVDDEHAWRFVAQHASYGSALHRRAIDFLRDNSGEGLEFESFRAFLDSTPVS